MSGEIELQSKHEILWIPMAKFQYLAESIPFGVMLVNENGKIIYFNKKFKEWFDINMEDVPDLDVWIKKMQEDFNFETESPSSWRNHFVNQQVHEMKYEIIPIINKKGIKKYFNIFNIPLGGEKSFILWQEITGKIKKDERMRFLENSLFNTQKLETIGFLIGEIAYNIQENLTDVLENVEIGLNQTSLSSPLFRVLSKTKEAGYQGLDLISKILEFIKLREFKPKVTDVSQIIYTLAKILGRFLQRVNIKLEVYSEQKLNPIYVDLDTFSQILINLTLYFRKITPSVGILRIETNNIHLGEEFYARYPFIIPGNYIRISIIQSGIEMIKEERWNLDNLSYMVKRNNGYILLERESNKGLRADLYFPIYERDTYRVILSDKEDIPKKKLTILLAEDDREIRKLSKIFLQGLGYNVLDASDGKEALRIFWESPAKIDLAILDLVMPEMDGITVYKNIQANRPDIPFLFVTGYLEEDIQSHITSGTKVSFLKKPFEMEDLKEKIHELISF